LKELQKFRYIKKKPSPEKSHNKIGVTVGGAGSNLSEIELLKNLGGDSPLRCFIKNSSAIK
jgi:hypothetical protein